MTPAKAAPMREDVTQADREAAADAAKAYRGEKDGNWQDRIRRGEADDGEMVQAFARHRLAHTARPDAASMDAKADNMEARPDAGDEDVERVARAIATKTYAFATVTDEGSDQYDCGEWEELGCDAQATYRDAGRAALAAMREGADRGMVVVPRARLDQFVEALAQLPGFADRLKAGQQFNAYDSANNDDDDEDCDRDMIIAIGPITNAVWFAECTGSDKAALLEAALKFAAEAAAALSPGQPQ